MPGNAQGRLARTSGPAVFYLLFTLSGFSGLIYESIWTHYLKLFLGHAAYAQTLVLAIFMGGMAAGSWVCSRYSLRWKNLLLGYAVTEGVIGLFALIFHNVFARTIEHSYRTVIPWLGDPAIVSAFKWAVSALLVLPQSILLGMTFPLMSAGILRLFPDRPGRSIGLLYFTNSIGAAVGVLASGFLLIRFVGLPGTIGIAGGINIALAVIVWLLVRSAPGATVVEHAGGGREQGTASPRYRLFLIASLITGLASFIYEIGWIRMLNLVLGTSTHAFELMLSTFIFGLAFGGLWVQRHIDHVDRPVRYLAQVQVVMGLLALLTLLLYGNTFEVMEWIVKTSDKTDTGYALFNLSSNAMAMAIMLPTTFCAGMTLPLITFILIREGHGERSIGAVYAANTVGAILGVFFAIHLGMPFLGLKGLITFGAGLDISLGLALFWILSADRKRYRVPAVITAVSACAVAGTLLFVHLDPYKMASGVYRFGTLFNPGDQQILYHKDGKTATVSLILHPDGKMSIKTNGKTDAAIMMREGDPDASDESTMALLAAIPMFLHPGAREVAVIGMGSGLTTHTLLGNPGLKRVDTVEIEREMVEAANRFRPRVELAYIDPRSHIYIDDAKTFFSTFNKNYDLIVSEPSNPWVSGVAGLFSGEFYRMVGRYLRDDGLFVQWMHLYEIDVELVVSVLKAVSANFSDYVVYAANDFDIIIVARKRGALPEMTYDLFKIPALARAMRRINVTGEQDLAIRRIGNRKTLDRLLSSFPVRANSDYYPVLDQNAARARFLGETANEFATFVRSPLPALEMLTGQGPAWRETAVNPSSYAAVTGAAFTAMALRDYFLQGSFLPAYSGLPESIRSDALLVKKLFHRCDASASRDEALRSLHATAIRMIPYLTPGELAAVWQRLESGPCAKALPPSFKKTVELFKATSRRDSKRMAAIAEELLVEDDHLTPGNRKYLLATAMLGSVAHGDYAATRSLWSRYQSMWFGGRESDLLFRLLAAETARR
jgi:spermidine synthase/MFS family permease